MFRRCLILLCLFSAFCSSLCAQTANAASREGANALPACIQTGLNAYKTTGPDDAVRAWKGCALFPDMTLGADLLMDIQKNSGAFQGYEIAGIHTMTPRTQVIYVVLDYENRPFFLKFKMYRTRSGWMIRSLSYNDDESAIFPRDLVE